MNNLSRLENQSIFIIREAYSQFRNVAMLWSIGKDSTSLLWLVRKAFFGQIPFPIIHEEHLRVHPLLGWREIDVIAVLVASVVVTL